MLIKETLKLNFESVSRSPIEERYALEELLMNAVSVGDTKNALEYQRRFRKHHLVPRTDDLVRNSQNMMIILNTLLRKAAQAGGVHPLHIDRLSTQIAIQIESMNTLHDLDAFGLTIVRRYCLLVQNYSHQNVSSLGRTCLNHIDFHYAEDLSLSQMATMCSVSSTHLSAQFRKEVQMTLTDYINHTRIHQALILLNTTALPIQEIAFQCGFSDANYFARTFKKLQGQAPTAYRSGLQQSSHNSIE